jgi:hypothetical protein
LQRCKIEICENRRDTNEQSSDRALIRFVCMVSLLVPDRRSQRNTGVRKRWPKPPMPVSAAMYMISPSRVPSRFLGFPTSITEKSLSSWWRRTPPMPKIQDGHHARTLSPCHHRALWYVKESSTETKGVSTRDSIWSHAPAYLMRAFPTPSIENSTTNGRRMVIMPLSCSPDHSLARRDSVVSSRLDAGMERKNVSYRAGVLVRRF